MKRIPIRLAFILCLSWTGWSCQPPPKKAPGICISFDDRFIREWHGLMPLLSKYNARVTFFVTQFDSLSNEELKLLHELQEHGHEIGSHGAIHVISENFIREHSYDEYLDKEVDASIRAMESKGFHPVSFAYPYGATYWFTDYLLLKRFSVVRKVAPVSTAVHELDDIYFDFSGKGKVAALSFDQGSALTREMLKAALQRASSQGEAILLFGHAPAASGDEDPYHFDVSLLEYILAESHRQGLRFYLASELVDSR